MPSCSPPCLYELIPTTPRATGVLAVRTEAVRRQVPLIHRTSAFHLAPSSDPPTGLFQSPISQPTKLTPRELRPLVRGRQSRI